MGGAQSLRDGVLIPSSFVFFLNQFLDSQLSAWFLPRPPAFFGTHVSHLVGELNEVGVLAEPPVGVGQSKREKAEAREGCELWAKLRGSGLC